MAGLEQARRAVDEPDHDHGLHDQAGKDEAVVRDAVDALDLCRERDAEDEDEHQGGDHLPGDREAPDLEEADDLALEQPQERRAFGAIGPVVRRRRGERGQRPCRRHAATATSRAIARA